MVKPRYADYLPACERNFSRRSQAVDDEKSLDRDLERVKRKVSTCERHLSEAVEAKAAALAVGEEAKSAAVKAEADL